MRRGTDMNRLRQASPTMNRSILAAAILAAVAAQGCATAPEIKPAPVVEALPPPAEPTAEEYQFQGVQALEARDPAGAKRLLGLAVGKDPRLLVAQYDLGVLAQAEGDLVEAARRFEAALAVAPDHEGSLLNLGKVYRDQQQYEKGIALYERALARRPFQVDYLNNLAVHARLAKQYDKATAAVRKLLSRAKDNPDAYKNLALIAYDQGQYRLAEFIGANAKKLDDKDPGIYNNLGLVYVKLGERRLALASFKKAVDLRPGFAPGLANIGALALSYRDYETAARAFEQVVLVEPTNAAARLNLAWSYEGTRLPDGTHRTRDAVAEFDKVLAQIPDQPDALYGLARAWAGGLRDLPKAKGFYERYLAVAAGPTREKAQKELTIVQTRIQAGVEVERMRKEAEARKRLDEEENRRKAREQAAAGGSMLDKVSEEAERSEPPPESPAPAPQEPKADPADGQGASGPAGAPSPGN